MSNKPLTFWQEMLAVFTAVILADVTWKVISQWGSQ